MGHPLGNRKKAPKNGAFELLSSPLWIRNHPQEVQEPLSSFSLPFLSKEVQFIQEQVQNCASRRVF